MTTEPTTSAPPELDRTDSALHAVLDDEATSDERRLVARLADAPDALNSLRVTAEAVGEVDAAEEADLDQIRSAAIERALDEANSGASFRSSHPIAEADRPDQPPSSEAPSSEAMSSAADGGTDDLASRRHQKRARRFGDLRRLPLPAVAAVVVVLGALGIGLIVTADNGGQGDMTASADAAKSAGDADPRGIPDGLGGHAALDPRAATRNSDGSESGDGDEPVTNAESADTPAEGHTGTEARQALLALSVASFDSDAALRRALSDVDPLLLDLEAEGVEPDRSARAFAADPRIRRCDTVVRSADTTLRAAQAARIVAIGEQPVVVLSNPVTATAEEPGGTRLTFLDADSCIPRGAVQR